MDEKLIKNINNIIWYIPFKTLRNSVRELLIKHFTVLEQLDNMVYDVYMKDKTSITDCMVGYKNICKLASENDNYFNIFRQNLDYKEVLEHVDYDTGKLYLDVIISRNQFDNNDFEKFKKNDLYGGATLEDFENVGKICPSTLRYIKVLSDLIIYFKTLDNFRICEIGVGYGGQSRIIMSYFNIKDYTYVDLESPLSLTSKYMNKFDDIDKNKLNFITMDELKNNKYDLIISNYAFSELTRNVQDIYTDKIIKNSSHGYITYNNFARFDNYKLDEYKVKFSKDIKIYEEEPNTNPLNKIIVW